eukprot:gene13874-15322_t
MSKLRFDERVVLITGAGRGLGKSYALAFADRGAKVVVNDLGGTTDGSEKTSVAADQVVEQIKANGGQAVANYDSVEDGDKIVKTAIDAFGRLDILVNNAGILRDRSFARMSDLDWSLIQKVHMTGAYKVTKAAWPHFKSQNFGRVIMTSSAVGIYGNFGQANYSAAKLGLVGLCNTLAIEGAKNNIFCNVVAPLAGSRLTENVLPKEFFNLLKPDYIAPFVLYLCHESCQENGALFETAAGWASRLRWQGTKGTQFGKWGETVTPELVRDHWEELDDWSSARNRSSTEETMSGIMSSLEEASNKIKQSPSVEKGLDPSKIIGYSFPETKFTYSTKDAILFALGVGVDVNKETNSHLKYLYENHEEFSVLPTFGVIFAQEAVFGGFTGGLPGAESIDMSQILHGEQYLELYSPLPAQATVSTTAKVTDLLDKGKGALLIIDAETKDENGKHLCTNQYSIYINKAGGFGGNSRSEIARPLADTPKRNPDRIVESRTSLEQAALYRLSGDLNPLHIDPNFAAIAGFKEPILHGLCSYGYAVRNIIETFAGGDVSKFKCIKARFNRPVIPGQTLLTEMWQEGRRIHFVVKVKESGDNALTGGYVDLHSSNEPEAAEESEESVDSLKCEAVFNEIANKVKDMPEVAKQINGVFLWKITNNGQEAGQWVMDFKSTPAKVFKGSIDGKADCSLVVSDDDFVAMASGQLNPQQAFFGGKLKIKGNVMLSQKLGHIFNQKAKL